MFSQAQLNTFGAALERKRISQNTFDEAVRENIEEFDMEQAEAIECAIEEFKSQGVDLTGIFTGATLQTHQIFQISSTMECSICQGDPSCLEASIRSLEAKISADNTDEKKSSEMVSVLLASNTVACFTKGVEVLQDDHATLSRFLRIYSTILLLSPDLREQFRSGSHTDAIPFDHCSVNVKCAALSVAGSLATCDEAGKAAVMSKTPHKYILEALEAAKETGSLHMAIGSTSTVITSLATADDLSQPSSSAFSNARTLAREGVASMLLDMLGMVWKDTNMINAKDKESITCQLCNGLKLLCANDEICKDMVDQGILQVLLRVLHYALRELSDNKPDMMISAMALLRQLLASDHVKHAIDTTEFISIVSSNLQFFHDDQYIDSSYRVIEHTLGSVSAMCLRNPDVSEAIVEHGCAQLIVMTLQTLIDRKESNKDALVSKSLRQGCMSIRNIASRSPQVRGVLKSYDTIEVIERAKTIAKTACNDVGDAAIRDITA